MNLEKLDNQMFQPLAASESASLYGGAAAGHFTYVGMTNINGNLERDNEWDTVVIIYV